ncbi:MAG: CPBP family intramembrane metalloprotease [Verrucomicrobiae bacterium]|nr:CPBP family intramembrane metalloprotease [Verrucomicrobiae bacterium]
MESTSESDPVPESDRKPGRWAWPAILLAPVLLLAGERFVPEAEAEVVAQHDLSLLAVLQVQAKLVIALNLQQPKEARKQLLELESYASSDSAAGALAATHGFLGLEDGGREAVDLLLASRAQVPGVDAAFLEAVRRATFQGVDEPGREILRTRLGWFADLFGTPGAPSEAPMGGEIRHRAMLEIVMMAVGGIIGVVSILIGAGVLLYAEFRRVGGKLFLAFDADRRPARIFLESFAIFLLSMALGNAGSWLVHWLMQPIFSIGGIVLALVWPRLRGLPWVEVCRSLGLHRGKGWIREVGAGVVGYFAMLPMAIIGIALSAGLVALVGIVEKTMIGEGTEGSGGLVAEPVTHPAVGWMLGGWEAKIMVLLLAAVMAPLVEEVFFRGAFYRALRSRMGMAAAGLLNGFIFASLHPQGWMAIPALTAMGFGFACLREWRDSLIAPMTAHAINNGLLIGGLALILR